MKNQLSVLAIAIALLAGCDQPSTEYTTDDAALVYVSELSEEAMDIYATVRLTTDLTALSQEDQAIIPLLIEAAGIIDGIFWKQSWGDKATLLNSIPDDATRRFAEINYGPWDRMNDNRSFVKGIGPKPAGANFYPHDMTKEEFEQWDNPHKSSLYTLIEREEKGSLKHVYYHEAYAEEVARIAAIFREAAQLSTNASFKFYLEERARAFETDRYRGSDIAWLNLQNNTLDVIIGPIETYEDQLFGYKAAHEAYVLVKDQAWSEKLSYYARFLPLLQKSLPVDKVYRQDEIGSNAQLSAYDVIYYAGDCNSGGKTIAVNLPNDIEIQQMHGTRRSQLKNAMRAKFDAIMVPIAELLIDESQIKHVQFDAFFANTMFHEVAHGLGIKNTINGKGSVREALKEQDMALEEGKADVVGLWMVTQLINMGELDGELMDYYVTFLAGIFRSVRFGSSSAHGKANMLRFNYFNELGAFTYDKTTGRYTVNLESMITAVEKLSGLILKLQGDGDYEGVVALMDDKGMIDETLQADLERVNNAGIPVDVVFEQGLSVLGIGTADHE
jgi:hypothetical protein